MIKIKRKKDCCGCEACVQICPQKCISFQQDAQGFFYPSVDINNCIDCGACNKVCPIQNVKEYSLPHITPVYAAYNKNKDQRNTSSSGGVFQLLASCIINKGGIVFGAKFDSDWNVVHDFAENIDEIECFKRSKYVQSRIGSNFKKVKFFLQHDKLVLFVGTPCQIAALKFYLFKDYENLVTIDVVCHGVPSPMIWRKYLQEKKHEIASSHEGLSIDDIVFTSISFRDKINSWRRYNLSFTYKVKNNDINVNSMVGISSQCVWENDYMLSFLHDYSNRPSCFDCKFRNGKCHSDLTLADFWGIENLTDDIELNGEKGTSLIMVHSNKGENIINELPCFLKQFAFSKSILSNPAILYNWNKPVSHSLFFRECKKANIKTAYKKAHKIQEIVEPIIKLKNKIEKKVITIWQK